MRFPRWSGALTVAAVTLAACQKAETPEQAASRMQAETEAARPAIIEVSARWARYASAGQPDSIVELYTPDGVMLPPDVPGATGRDSMRARLATLLAPGAVLTITTASVTVNGPLAVERGNWTYAIPAQAKTPAMTATGKYLSHYHNVNGQWLIAENIWNRDTPAPPPPPAARQGR
jgi:ketosteroid isomerase-like protein